MRLLIDGTTIVPDPKGVGRYALEVSRRIAADMDRDWEVDLLVFEGNAGDLRGTFSGNIIEIPHMSEFRRGVFEIPRWIRARQPDVLLRLNESAGRNYRLPTVTVCHDVADLIRTAGRDSPGYFRRLKDIVLDRLRIGAMRDSAAVVAVSGFLRDQLVSRSWLRSEAVVVAYCGVDDVFASVDIDRARQLWLQRLGFSRYILSFATGDPRENGELLPLILRCLRTEGCAAPLVVAGLRFGTPFADRLQMSFVREGLVRGKDFELLGFLGGAQRKELADLYAASALYLELSGHEGFGMQLAEALRTGTNCVSSGCGALSEVGGRFATQFATLSAPEIARKVTDVLESGEREAERNEQMNFAAKYDWASTAGIIREAIEKLRQNSS